MFDVLLLGLLSREVSRGSLVLRVKVVVEDKQIAADAKIKSPGRAGSLPMRCTEAQPTKILDEFHFEAK